MKAILIACGILLVGACAYVAFAHPFRHHYGKAFENVPTADIGLLLEKPEECLQKSVRVEGAVARQCPHCGCWLVLRDSLGKELRVEIGDLGEPIPFRPGRRTTVEGRLIRYGDGVEVVGSSLEFR